MARKPKYCRHKATNRAYVTMNGKEEYLGEYDSPDSHERYRELVTRWELENASDSQLTLLGLAAKFMVHAEKHYRRRVKGGTTDDCFVLTGEHANIRQALRGLCAKYGNLRVSQFTAKHLQEHQTNLVTEPNLCRNTINARIRHVFKWAAPLGLVTPRSCPLCEKRE